jgi:monofunctional biosynthetic peptidoglycan transglycosylase
MGEASMAADNYQTLYDFAETDAANEWQTVNDSVMGGISNGRIRITAEKTMVFYGTLSLDNNGGFASVRSKPQNLDLNMRDTLVVRARGDGREYSLNLYTQRRLTAFSYRAMFTTKENEWLEVRIPMDRFVATSFGQILKDQPLDPKEVNGLGILLGDKNEGPFKLEIEWIKVMKAE